MGLGIFMGYLEMSTICRPKYIEGSSLGEVLHGKSGPLYKAGCWGEVQYRKTETQIHL